MAEPPSFERPEPDPPSAEEVAAVLNEAWGDARWGLFLWLTIVSGCRRGETCALRWTDLDLARGVMTIERSYSETAERRREKSTKSGQKRRLAIDPYTVELLTAYRAECESDCAKLGETLPRTAFVFSLDPDGSTPPAAQHSDATVRARCEASRPAQHPPARPSPLLGDRAADRGR
jgi:integrase